MAKLTQFDREIVVLQRAVTAHSRGELCYLFFSCFFFGSVTQISKLCSQMELNHRRKYLSGSSMYPAVMETKMQETRMPPRFPQSSLYGGKGRNNHTSWTGQIAQLASHAVIYQSELLRRPTALSCVFSTARTKRDGFGRNGGQCVE